jgi:hypothetical protein
MIAYCEEKHYRILNTVYVWAQRVVVCELAGFEETNATRKGQCPIVGILCMFLANLRQEQLQD